MDARSDVRGTIAVDLSGLVTETAAQRTSALTVVAGFLVSSVCVPQSAVTMGVRDTMMGVPAVDDVGAVVTTVA